MLAPFRNRLVRRLVLLAIAAILVLNGAVAVSRGRPAYDNYWGGKVFPPLAIAAGIASAVFALRSAKPSSRESRRERLERRRLAKRPRMRFPHEDARKW
jgi:hypothetical protein